MNEYTDVEEMIEHAEVGDSIKITYKQGSVNGTEPDIGVIEERDGYYNVLFEDGYGDSDWHETSLKNVIAKYCKVWNREESVSLLKRSCDKPKDPQEVYEFIAKSLKQKYGDYARYGYSDGSFANANKIGIGAGIAVDCDDQPNGTDIWINVGYFY